MNKEKLGILIKEIRMNQNMTQKELAQKLHVTDKAVSKWERGASFPDLTTLEPLAKVLDISILDFFIEESEDDNSILKSEAENIVEKTLDISKNEMLKVNQRNQRTFLILFIVFLFTMILFILYLFKNGTTFELKADKYIENNSTIAAHSGLLYEQDVVYIGKLNQDIIKNYVKSITLEQDEVIGIRIRFYKHYDDNQKIQPTKNLKYEVLIYL